MIFGGKAEYKKEELPFCYIKNKEDIETTDARYSAIQIHQ